MRRLLAVALSCAAVTLPALAQAQALPVVISAQPDTVAVTVYRDPDRGTGEIDRGEPTAFALIVETRTVTLPPGQAVVRFEGVASGVVPQSAILFGTDPRERNRDAALLSQKGLVDAFTGQQVTLRRTDPATGAVVEERARIRSVADRLVIETPRGIEAVYCSGLNQTLLYPEAPATLSAKPVLSMTTKDQPGGRATITLAYLATGFDWDATYVATIAPDGQSLALLAWLTLASGDETTFADATTAAVAGKVGRSDETRDDEARNAVWAARQLNRSYGCWPAGTTTTDVPMSQPLPPAPMMVGFARGGGEDIVVTAMRRSESLQSVPIAVTAKAESLGDLKLYRIPVPVTVAARSQKQVAFMVKPRVTGEVIYRSRVEWMDAQEPQMLFRFRNTKASGLGEPLPAGKAILYQDGDVGRQFVGETATVDKALDEEVELVFGDAGNLTLETDDEVTKDRFKGDRRISRTTRHSVVLRNANPFPVRYELEFPLGQSQLSFTYPAGRVIAKPGKRVWQATIPAGDTVRTEYSATEREDE